ncbi:MAG: flagellin [Blautia sp.]|nr:flagellin [Lachnoclostridium sp.]MCM1210062.1 flagellin [Blautia sp.]
MVITHNMEAMNANRMFNLTNKSQAKSMEKLSSGYKINRSADDAAGLFISERMRRQLRGINQAAANAMDGISCVQVAEGALNEVHDMLQRMGELAVKGANGTLTTTDRCYVTMEVRQLMSEIDRIQSTTTFNEQNLLDGTFKRGLQVGADSGQHIVVSIGSMSTNDLIASALSKGIYYQTNNESPLCNEMDMPTPTTADYPYGSTAYWIPGSNTTWAKQEYWDKSMVLPWGTPGHSHLLGAYDLTIFHSFSYFSIVDAEVRDRLTNTYPANTTGGSEEPLSEELPDVRNFQALNAFVKSAVADVSETRSSLGAIQNRLEHTINNLNNIAENTAAAESAIRDTDIGMEMVRFSNNSILVQSGQSMLAQANQSRQGALALLQ